MTQTLEGTNDLSKLLTGLEIFKRAISTSIPLMIGAKKAMPERTCVAFMGDAAFGMSGLDMETAVRAELPITVALLNNGIMATYPGGTPTAREQFGVTHMTGNYAQIATGLGAEGIHHQSL